MKYLLSIFLVASASASLVQKVDESAIASVIRCAEQKGSNCERPYLTPEGFDTRERIAIRVLPPLGRIYEAAFRMRVRYLPFTRADVTEDMLSPTIVVSAISDAAEIDSLVDIDHIVIVPRRSDTGAVQPIAIEEWSQEVRNKLGYLSTITGQRAVFEVSALPAGELDVVLISKGNAEYRAGISGKDRAKLDLWSGVR